MKNGIKYHSHKIIGILVLTSILLLAFLAVFINEWKLELNLNGCEFVNTQLNEDYKDPGATANVHGSILFFIKKDVDVKVDNNIDTSKIGENIITYSATYGNKTISKERIVHVKNFSIPSIELTYDKDNYTPYNHEYEEEGYTCIDKIDGDITDKVKSVQKNGNVYYSVVNSSGIIARAKRKIIYDDRKGPEITLNGGEDINVIKSSNWNDEYSAIDDVDGDITDKVKVEGSVDLETIGDYTLTYSVSDSHDNKTTVTRIVHVTKKLKNNSTGAEGPYVIYLTFDDGPGQYTDQLLDILDKYNVKATFFTTSAYPSYAYCIAKEAKAGHTVAVHTATHNYATIYSSAANYWADFNKQNDVIKDQTGSSTTLFRFPGGSSNTISRNYCSGVVSAIAADADAYGYTYFDWNVSSGDAGGTTDTNTVYNNVITQVAANTRAGYPSVVLQHDIKGFSVDAVESIIQWGLQNGYSFQPLTSSSFTAHHSIAN